MKYSLFIGRYQPLHLGHKTIIDKVLNEGKNVLIALRNTPISKENPYSVEQRRRKFRKFYPKSKYGDRVKIIKIEDIEEVCYGRKVGWGIRRIKAEKKIENISATKIRENDKDKFKRFN